MIKLGSQEVTKVMKGTEEVSAIYRGSDEVWSADQGVDGWIKTDLSAEGILDTGSALYDFAHNGNVWAVAGNKGSFATSPDGVNWSNTGVKVLPEEDEAVKNLPEEMDLVNGDFRGIVWTGTHWIVAGSSGNCTRSSDGVNWTTVPSMSTAVNNQRVLGIVAHPSVSGEAIAVAGRQGARTVNNGSTFTAINMGVDATFYDLAHNGSYWCAIGNTACSTSSNGTSWTGRNISGNYRAIAWNGSVWCALGSYGLCATSSDGLNWTTNQGINNLIKDWSCRAVTSDGERFFAVGNFGKVLVSEDGLVWEEHSQTPHDTAINKILLNDRGTVLCDSSTSVSFNEELKPAPLWDATGGFEMKAGGGFVKVGTSSDFNPRGGDYTLEGWFNFDRVGGTQCLFDWRNVLGTTGVPAIYFEGVCIKYYHLSGIEICHQAVILPRRWYHVAVCHKGGVVRLFVDGVVANTNASVSSTHAAEDGLQIGSLNGSYGMSGYCDGIRYTSEPRYPTNASFDPPIVPYPLNNQDPLYYANQLVTQGGEGHPVGAKMTDRASAKTYSFGGTNGAYQLIPTRAARRREARQMRREALERKKNDS